MNENLEGEEEDFYTEESESAEENNDSEIKELE